MQNLYQQHTQAGKQKVSKMPGHIKKTSGPDPDPSPWVKDNSHQSLTTKSFSKTQSLGSTRQIQPILRMIAKSSNFFSWR